MSLCTRLWRTALVAALAVLVGASAALATAVDPSAYSTTLAPGGSTTLTKTVHTPAIPPKVDILFLADTTGSMGPAIGNVQANAASILAAVRTAQPDSQFGAAEYRDFNCTDPFAYRLDQAITSSLTDAQNGINAWATGDGCDVREAQINALYTLATDPGTGFRTGSTRVVVWFGDASGHDPSGGHSLAHAVAALQAANVIVIAVPVNSGFGDGLDATGQATAVTTATAGQLLPSATPGDVAAAILSGLANLPATVAYTTSCSPGVTVSLSPSTQTVTSGDDAVFTETISLDANPPAGVLGCTVSFTINGTGGADLVQTVSVNRAPSCSAATAGADLWPPNHALSGERVVSGVTDADGDPVTIHVHSIFQDEPTNGFGDGDTGPSDAVILDADSFQVRAERSGTGDGRVYYVNFTATDAAGGTCTGVATIGVPHDRGDTAVGGGQLFNSIP